VRYQRDISFANYTDLETAISENCDAIYRVDPVSVLSYMGELFELNLTSALFWEFIESPAEYNNLLDKFMLVFEVDISTLQHDLASIINEFETAGLIEVIS